jgi:photosystem II stability/assembly factor-like uncharacterized protein
MKACMSPNGLNTYPGQDPITKLLVGTLNGIDVLEREGPAASWRQAGKALEGKHISSLLLEAGQGGIFAGVHDGSLYFSADDGKTWEQRSKGINIDHVFSLGAKGQNGSVVLYAGTEPPHLFSSSDYGESWQEIASAREVPDNEKWTFPAPPHTGHFKTYAFDSRDPNLVYAGVEQGAFLKSTDGGRTWQEMSGYSKPEDEVYRDVHQILLRPTNQDEVFMTGGCGLYHSPDKGKTWEHLTDRNFRIGYPDQLQFHPDDDRMMFMTGSAMNPGKWRQSHDAQATVMRTRDGGRSWEPAGKGLPEHMRPNIEAMALASWPGGFGLFIGDTDGDVYASEDGADSWTKIATLAPVSKGGHYHPLQAAAA